MIHYKVRISRNCFSNDTFFNTGSSHFQVDTRLYFVSYPLFLISQSTWLFCCLFVRFFRHVCPCQWHPWNWYTVLGSVSYPSNAPVFFAVVIKIPNLRTMLSPPCPHILFLYPYHKTPSHTSLRCAWIYRPSR